MTNIKKKFGYNGCNQLTDVVLIDNDDKASDFNKTWIEDSTMKQIIDTPVSEDISTNIYKITALVKRLFPRAADS